MCWLPCPFPHTYVSKQWLFYIYFLAYVVQSYILQIYLNIAHIIDLLCSAWFNLLAKDDEESSYPGIITGQAALSIVQRA
jgi:hypothetical protein